MKGSALLTWIVEGIWNFGFFEGRISSTVGMTADDNGNQGQLGL